MSSESDDTEVMFEIGVMESPETASRITELARQVLSSQDSMRQGVERIGLSAKAVSASLAPLRSELQGFRKDVESLFADLSKQSLKASVRPVRPQMQKPERVQDDTEAPVKLSFKPLAVEAKSLREEAAKMLKDVERAFEQISNDAKTVRPKESTNATTARDLPPKPFVPTVPSPAQSPVRPQLELPKNIESVMKQLGDDLQSETDSIIKAFESKVASLPNSLVDVNSRIKAEYDKRVKDQAAAYDRMAKDLDDAVEKQSSATEAMNSAVVKGAKAVVGAAKGFAELGLVSEESSEQLLKGLVAVQGVVDILDGSVDLIESFSQGWKAARQSIKAATDVQKAQQAIQAASLPQLKAMQVSLAAEAAAANTAAAAHVRLGAARRGAAGGAATSAVSGVASQAVGSAVGSVIPKAVGGVGGAVAGGAGATTIAGVGVGVLGTIAAAGAALASVSLVAVELKETLSGQATAHDSLTNKIAEYESAILAGGLRMTGMFESFDSPAVKLLQSIGSMTDGFVTAIPGLERFKDQINLTGGLLGDLAGLAASTAGVERAQKSLAKNRITNDAGRQREAAQEDFEVKRAKNDFSLRSEIARLRADNFGPATAKAEAEQAKANDRLSVAQDALRGGDQTASLRIDAELARILQTQRRLNSVGVRGTDEQLSKERDLQSDAKTQLERSSKRVAGIQSGEIVANDGEAAKAGQTMMFWRDQLRNSIEKEIGLVKSKNDLEIAGQQRVGELLKNQLDLKRQQLQTSRDEQKGSMLNFARLSDVDKVLAKDALEAARTKGAGDLSDQQKDLLRNVGTKEALSFAEQGDIAEAKRFGFNEQNFARDFKKEQDQLVADAKRLEAQVSSTYDVKVQLETDTQGLIADLVSKTKQLLSENNQVVQEQLARELEANNLSISNKTADQLRQLKK